MHPEPIATYRLQMRSGFGFEQAAAVVPYLSALGISHLYTSPYLQAAAGSTHGYDIVDPTGVDEALGGSEAHARLCETLLSAGLGQMIDVVPNHMAIMGGQNPWWWDVLENGPSSRYATYFDVDWKASKHWPNKILLPVLGDHSGRILEKGELQLVHKEGNLILHYHDHIFPMAPSSLANIFGRAAQSCGSDLLAFLAESHARLLQPASSDRKIAERHHRDKTVLSDLLSRLCLESPEVTAAIDDEVVRLNQDTDALGDLLDQQNYRLAFWRTASRQLVYRRFFDIKDLVGVRIEDREVFLATHALVLGWIQKGWVHGLRIDHPDGLREPGDYFHRLRAFCPDAWIVAEKILEPDETLPADWPIAGTTGYDFLNLVGGLFIDPEGENGLARFYDTFTGVQTDFGTLVRECKRLVITELFESELTRLTALFVKICERHRRYRDFSRQELREALCECAICFPVYRSYVSATEQHAGQTDERFIDDAIKGAMAGRSELDPELFHFLKDLLLLRVTGTVENELAMRFQQLTGPAMAKGVEDTAFYRYHRLISLNEVGGDPACFGVPLERFHKACTVRQAEHPQGLLASTTHDTKRSEDVRARLALLSEIPDRWTDAVRRWSSHNERHRGKNVPDRNTEYLFYQTLVGAWPIDLERITAYMEKAVREAKMHTSWTTQNQRYERNLSDFIRAVLEDEGFRLDLKAFVTDLVAPGRINSLAQTLIKLTAPGVPDIYQGTELWDLSLVDPDNRRPVDFALRRHLLDEVEALPPEAIMARMDEGLPKLWVIRQILHLRRSRPKPFGPAGSYRPLYAQGGKAHHVVAFIRGGMVLSVTPRLTMGLNSDWSDTKLEIPEGRWHNILTGDKVTGGPVSLQELLSRFPVGLLVQGDG